MENIKIHFDRNSKIYDFDTTITKNLYFESEILDSLNDFKLINKKRYVIDINDLSFNKMYIYNMNITATENGFLIDAFDTKTLLIPGGENFYLLAYTNANIKNLHSILYTFLSESQNYIDITLYKHLFIKNFKILNLYKKK